MPISNIFDNPAQFLLGILAVVFGITIHEFSHALAGKLQGDNTAEDEGRLTLNPLSHIDLVGFLAFILVGFGWAKPTPFNPYNLKYKRFGPALVALAGPISNFTAVVLLTITLYIINNFTGIPPTNMMVEFFYLLIWVNVVLTIFNLIPIPPLDGSKVLYTFLGGRRPDLIEFLERYGVWLLIALVFFGGRLISPIFSFFYYFVVRLST